MVTVNIRRDSPTAQGSPHGVDAERIRLREQGDGVLAESLLPPFAALADLPRDEKPVWSSGLMVEWHTFLLPFEGCTEPLALALKLGHLRIDVHELAEVVASLARSEPTRRSSKFSSSPASSLSCSELLEGALWARSWSWPIRRPAWRVISGNRSGPKTTRQTSRITKTSPTPTLNITGLQPARGQTASRHQSCP
jgi:hypothetical protein